MKKLCIMLVLVGAVLSMTGCNTVRGMGRMYRLWERVSVMQLGKGLRIQEAGVGV